MKTKEKYTMDDIVKVEKAEGYIMGEGYFIGHSFFMLPMMITMKNGEKCNCSYPEQGVNWLNQVANTIKP